MMRERSERREAMSFRPLLLVAGVVLAAGCAGDHGPGIVANGTVEVREIDVAPLAAGRVVRVLVDEGESVAAGDTVVILTAPTLGADLDAAMARVATAQANVRDLEAGARPQELAAARSDLAAARAEAGRLARDRDRMAALLDAGAVARSEYDAVDAAATMAAERVTARAEQVSLLEAGSRPARIAAARAELEQARAALAARRASTAEYVLTAPVDGVVLSRVADPGDLVAVGVPALVLGVMAEPWVRVYVPARGLPSVVIGTEAVIYPPGAGGRWAGAADADDASSADTVRGRVIAINPQAEYVTRMALTEDERADLLFGVKVAIDDPVGRFQPGMPVAVRLLTRDTLP